MESEYRRHQGINGFSFLNLHFSETRRSCKEARDPPERLSGLRPDTATLALTKVRGSTGRYQETDGNRGRKTNPTGNHPLEDQTEEEI